MTAQMGQIVAYVEQLARAEHRQRPADGSRRRRGQRVCAPTSCTPSLDRDVALANAPHHDERVLPRSRRAGRVSHVVGRPYRHRTAWPNSRPAEITSVELTQAYLDQIARHDGQVQAFLRVDAGRRRSSKRGRHRPAPPRRTAAGRALAGLPVAVKDLLCTEAS